MSVQGRVDEAAAVMEGQLISGRPQTEWQGASLDSRTVRGAELFFALPGEQSDGHLYVGAALERGASAVVVDREVETPEGAGVIRVADTFAALHLLTREVRRRTPSHLVAVTGSIGKTTLCAIMRSLASGDSRTIRRRRAVSGRRGVGPRTARGGGRAKK